VLTHPSSFTFCHFHISPIPTFDITMNQSNGSTDSELLKVQGDSTIARQQSVTGQRALLPKPGSSFTPINASSAQHPLALRPSTSNLASTLHHHNPLPSNPAQSEATKGPGALRSAFTTTSFPPALSARRAQAPNSQVTGSGNDSTLGGATSGAKTTQRG